MINPEKLSDFHNNALADLLNENVISRIWQKDFTVWKKDPGEISNRLGWLESPENMLDEIAGIEKFVAEIQAENFENVLLLGMGGSSLAPEVFSKIFGSAAGFPNLAVLDSTDPGAILHYQKNLNLSETLFIVSTKSGGTVETLSFAKYFFRKVSDTVGPEKAGSHFAAITDPGSGLEKLAGELNYRKIFLNDSDIGGRFSALTHFGLIPVALIGIDLEKLLQRTQQKISEFRENSGQNTAAQLGAFLGEAAIRGRDKVTFVSSEKLKPFIAWVEQLIAESTGKEGKGILPLEIESRSGIENFSSDRIFVSLALGEEDDQEPFLEKLEDAAHPVIRINLLDIYDLGPEFFRWELATAVAGWRLKINPFDQPNVESAKIAARNAVAAFQEKGKLPELQLVFKDSGIKVFGTVNGENLAEIFKKFFQKIASGTDKKSGGSYISLQAYLPPEREIEKLLEQIREKVFQKYGRATTIGFGPRFLHSTGQLHKGDAGKALFVQLVSDSRADAGIPDNPDSDDSSMSFQVLKTAQSLGDRQALIDAGRNVLRLELAEAVTGLNKILLSLN